MSQLSAFITFEGFPNNAVFLSSEDDVNSWLVQQLPKCCGGCQESDTMVAWPYPAKNPILISVGHLRSIEIPVLLCTECRTANYVDLTSHGVFSLHNKCLISVDYILELKDALTSGKVT